MQEELKVKLADARACYANASNEVKEVLEHLFGREAFAFDFRSIKSFEDACKHLGISDELPAQRAGVAYDKEAVEQSLAAYKLMVICKAINNGQQYDEDGDTWFPLYYFYTKSELERMGEDERKRKGIQLLSAVNADMRSMRVSVMRMRILVERVRLRIMVSLCVPTARKRLSTLMSSSVA